MADKRTIKKTFAQAAKRFALAGMFGAALFGGVAGGQSAPVIHATPAALDTTMVMSEPQARSAGTQALKPVFDLKSLPYDQQVFQFNAMPTQTPVDAAKLAAMTPEQRLDYYKQNFCFTAGQTPADLGTQKDLFDAFDSLSKMTLLGKPLVELADSNNLRLCNLHHLPAGIAAQYMPGAQAVVSGPFTTKEERVLKLAHEITHAAQDKNGLLNYMQTWDINSRVQRNLSTEAAALTSEFMVAYEAKLDGDSSYWDLLQTHFGGTTYTDKQTYTLIETTYQDAITAGTTKDEALRRAGSAVWLHVFESQEWRDYYLNLELSNYLKDINEGAFKSANTIEYQQFGQSKVDLAGKVGTLESFTKGDAFPDVAGLLNRNPKMRWAYEAAEIARHKQMNDGKTNATADMLRAQALLGGNPYLDLDITAAYRKSVDDSFTEGKSYRYLYEVLDDMLQPAAPAPAVPPIVATAPRAAVG